MDNYTREMVDYFLEDKQCIPLMFYNLPKEREPRKTLGLKGIVYHCLELTGNYHSQNTVTNNIETSSDRFRSVYDIWRHVLYYRPKVTIIDVMNTLWRFRRSYIGHYCPDIQRRVFKVGSGLSWEGMPDQDVADEFDLYFEDWKKEV